MALTLTFGFQFIAAKIGKTGLVPTFIMRSVNRTTGAISAQVVGNCTELHGGMYFVQIAGCDPKTFVYFMTAHTNDASVDQQDVPAFWAEFSPSADQITFFPGGDPATGDSAVEVVVMYMVNDTIRNPAIQPGAMNGKGDWPTAGNGAHPVDHNGGAGVTVNGVASAPDCLRYVGTDGGGQNGLIITAYLKSEWDAVPTVRNPKGITQTGVDGRWLNPLNLNSGTYNLVADSPADGYETQLNVLVVP